MSISPVFIKYSRIIKAKLPNLNEAQIIAVNNLIAKKFWKATTTSAKYVSKLEGILGNNLFKMDKYLSKSVNPSQTFRMTFEHIGRVTHMSLIKDRICNQFTGCLIEFIIAYYLGYLLAYLIFQTSYGIWKGIYKCKMEEMEE